MEARRRIWTFANCRFDEANWTLEVAGRRVTIETKPLELLRTLLVHRGNLVTKDELMDSIWPGIAVVEASLPTAVAKLRRALNDDIRQRPMIETVPRIGYRLSVPVEIEEVEPAADEGQPSLSDSSGAAPNVAVRDPLSSPRRDVLVLLLAGLVIVLALLLAVPRLVADHAAPSSFSRAEVFNVLRKADVETIEDMLADGWDPNVPLDQDSNSALNLLLNNCEWDRGHDRQRLLLAVRTLVDGGARITDRNAWGDTPYSIASADRFCGPDHPVTRLLRMICTQGDHPLGKRCLAAYRRDAAGKVIRQPPMR